MNNDLFWDTPIEDLKRGFIFDKVNKTYTCLICEEVFEEGVIYPTGTMLFDAKKAIDAHVKTEHSSIFEFLLGLGRVYTGFSDGQTELARLFYQGLSDKEIVGKTSANSASTIRNQRFAIREKYKQAKITVALVELMEERMEYLKQEQKEVSNTEKFTNFHPKATCIDERFAITQAEKEEVLNRYFDSNNKLIIKAFPAKEKKKIIILQKIIGDFKVNKNYTELEVNEALKRYYDDFVTVRRYMIQYGFMDRDKEGKSYWVK